MTRNYAIHDEYEHAGPPLSLRAGGLVRKYQMWMPDKDNSV